MDEELSVESAIAVVKESVERLYNEYCEAVPLSSWDGTTVREEARPVVFGYSMGAYISMAVTGVCSEWMIVPRAFAIGGGNFNMNQVCPLALARSHCHHATTSQRQLETPRITTLRS